MKIELDIEICLTQALNEVNIPNTPIKIPYSKKKQRKENKGIIVTIDNFLAPTVTYIQALPFSKLPAEYLSAANLPKVWQDGDKLLAGDNHILLEKDKTYTRGGLVRILQYIKLAGEHLAMVRKGKDRKWYNSSTATFKDGKCEGFSLRE